MKKVGLRQSHPADAVMHAAQGFQCSVAMSSWADRYHSSSSAFETVNTNSSRMHLHRDSDTTCHQQYGPVLGLARFLTKTVHQTCVIRCAAEQTDIMGRWAARADNTRLRQMHPHWLKHRRGPDDPSLLRLDSALVLATPPDQLALQVGVGTICCCQAMYMLAGAGAGAASQPLQCS